MNNAGALTGAMSCTLEMAAGSMMSVSSGVTLTGGVHEAYRQLTPYDLGSSASRIWRCQQFPHHRHASCSRALIWITIPATTTPRTSLHCANDVTWRTIVRNIVGSAGGRSSDVAQWETCSSAHTANERKVEDNIMHIS